MVARRGATADGHLASRHVGGDGSREMAALHVSARELLDSIPDAVLGVSDEGIVVFVNVQAERMFGYERDELLGRPVELLLPDGLASAHARYRAGYHAHPTTRPMAVGLPLLGRRKDGSELPVEISLSPMRTVAGMQVVAAVRDVTERRAMEIERQRLKDDLANMIVHDLKSPVNGIAMTTQLLLRKGGLSQPQLDAMLRVRRTCDELLRLIGNVLEIATIEAGAMPVASEAIALADLVGEIAADYGPVASEVGRRLTVAVGPDVPVALADRGLLKRVLVNLIANALRHSGSTEVSVEALSEPAGASVVIRVTDHGEGIPESDQRRLFEKFGTRRRDPTADTGLGLPFCKLAVECMQGTLALRSAPGTGTTFIVSLPRADG